MTPKEALEMALANGSATEGVRVRLPELEPRQRPQGGCNGLSKKRSKKEARTEKEKAEKLFSLLCEKHGLPEPVHEYEFHPSRKWRFDFLFSDWLAVEKEGGVYGRGEKCPACGRKPVGAHSSIQNLLDTMEKYNEAGILGYIILRFTPEQFEDGSAFAVIRRALEGE